MELGAQHDESYKMQGLINTRHPPSAPKARADQPRLLMSSMSLSWFLPVGLKKFASIGSSDVSPTAAMSAEAACLFPLLSLLSWAAPHPTACAAVHTACRE